MKAVTVRQPWATLIALGMKRFETRSWQTKYRGPNDYTQSNLAKTPNLNEDEKRAINQYISSDSYKINEKLRNKLMLATRMLLIKI